MIKISPILVMLVFVCAGISLAETYKWVDDSGTVHFTDDLSQVPKKYGKKVRAIGDVGPSEPAADERAGGARPVKGTESAPAAGGSAGDSGQKKDKLYGGRSGADWQNEFATLKANVGSTDAQIAELNGRLSDTSSMSRTEFLSIQNSIKNLRFHREEVSKKLDALNEAASRAGLPGEFR
jgi:hypothetical protein